MNSTTGLALLKIFPTDHVLTREIFSGALPPDMPIDWNVRLTKTAGLCYSK